MAKKVVEVQEPKLRPELEELALILTSPRPRTPTTLKTYLGTAADFLNWLGDRVPPSERDLRRYFIKRRDDGLSEATLATIYNRIKKLYQANHWDWPMIKEDRPVPNEPENTPAFSQEDVETLITNRSQYTKIQMFYLAIATTYIVRRTELAAIQKRDIKDHTIRIETAKKHKPANHLIPEQIAPYLTGYHPKKHEASALSLIFREICKKGLGDHRPGYGWHSIRRTLTTLLEINLAKVGKTPALVGIYGGWSRSTIGARYYGAPMVGHYSHPEQMTDDPFIVDREIFEIHPFLSLWQQTPAKRKAVKEGRRTRSTPGKSK